MRILGVKQIKPIDFGNGSTVFPLSSKTKIVLDKKSPSNRKEHQLIYQQGPQYGSVGDCCKYLDNFELLELESKGFITIRKTN